MISNFTDESLHCTNHRPWGFYYVIEKGNEYKVKHIVINSGVILSLQLHEHRSEYWIIVHGTAKVTSGDEYIILYENQNVFIPRGQKHRVENIGNILLEIIEIQKGSYLGEDDIIRLEDRYGRI